MGAFGFLKKRSPETKEDRSGDRGFLVFENTSEVIQAENLLRREGWEVRVMGPPPGVRTGCDLVIEFPLIEELKIRRILQEAGLRPIRVVPVTSPLLEPVNLFQVRDFGQYLMVQAANMKLTIEKETLTIVNISGGGCPDVPYLAEEMVGKVLTEAPSPRVSLSGNETQMLAVVGTIPKRDFPLVAGKVTVGKGEISIAGNRIAIKRGTSALLAAAGMVGRVLGQEEPFANLVGDIGRGDGSEKLYRYLVEALKEAHFRVMAFHYVQPHVGWHSRILSAIRKSVHKPILIADAGFMYAAKMSGRSSAYDLFTPDMGELAFLADELAPHPFYTRGFLLYEVNRVPDLIARAYEHGNAARYLLVKGKRDYLANKEGIQAVIEHPLEEAMEAIGGTGDTLTGIVSALIASGMEVGKASILAAQANRLAGYYARPSPGTQVSEIVCHLPEALEEVMKREKEDHEPSRFKEKSANHP